MYRYFFQFSKVLLLCVLTISLFACTGDKEKAEKHYNRAMEYAERKDYDKAAEEFRKSLDLDGEKLNALFNLAVTCTYIDIQSPEAEELFLKVVKKVEALGSGSEHYIYLPNSYYGLASIYSIRNEKEKALDMLEESVKAGFNDYEHLVHDSDMKNISEENRFKQLKDVISRSSAGK